jgi:hypothetical protein
MRDYSLSELFCLTRAELFALHARIVAELASMPETGRAVALDNLRNIRRILAKNNCSPG